MNRRFFLGQTVAAGAVGFPLLAGTEVQAGAWTKGRPKRIIHLVSDGMSAGTFACADQLSAVVRKRSLAWRDLYERPEAVAGLVDMRSLNSLVTDSAAASSSWGSGSRVKNGALNVLPDGRELRTLCDLFGEKGWVRGLVTTAEITHATPAGFAVNVPSRNDAETIALQYLERRIEVLLGGGAKHFDPKRREDKRDLKQEFGAWGYRVMRHRDDLTAAPLTDRWLGIFASGHIPYSVDRQSDPGLQETVPTLGEMTERALGRLERYGHFLLQVEGGRIDHGAHASDAPAMLFDQLAFDEAVEVCLAFQRKHPDTLLVITTDHGNSNPALNGMGSSYSDSPSVLANLTRATCSYGGIRSEMVAAAGPGAEGEDTLQVDPKVVSAVLEKTAGYAVPEELATRFSRYLAGEWKPLNKQLDSFSAQLGQLLANHYGVGWTGTSHTSDYVMLLALGPGADRFGGFQRNTDLFRHYTDLARIRHRNPELPLLAECGPSAAEAEGDPGLASV